MLMMPFSFWSFVILKRVTRIFLEMYLFDTLLKKVIQVWDEMRLNK